MRQRHKKRLLAAVACALCGCDAKVTSTFVDGTVSGVAFAEVSAVSVSDKNLLGASRHTVWLGDPTLICSAQRGSATDLGAATHLASPDGGSLPLLIVNTAGNAWLDTGNGPERRTGASDTRVLTTDANGKLTGRFTATFGNEKYTGDFMSTPCPQAFAGCASAPELMVLGALLWLGRRRSGQRQRW